MKVKLKTGKNLDHYIGETEKGLKIDLGNNGEGVGPMQAVLMAAAGCSTIDIIMILKKMKQDVKGVEVEVEGKRREEIPRTFTDIHLHYIITGDVKEKKAKQAMDLSLEKYCSVSLMLEKAAKISGSFTIVN